jgi:hypothetical protein
MRLRQIELECPSVHTQELVQFVKVSKRGITREKEAEPDR